MNITVPDSVAGPTGLTEQELRLELACALYARGRIGKIAGAQLAGLDFFTFQGALGERGLSSYSLDMVEEDVQALRELPPR